MLRNTKIGPSFFFCKYEVWKLIKVGTKCYINRKASYVLFVIKDFWSNSIWKSHFFSENVLHLYNKDVGVGGVVVLVAEDKWSWKWCNNITFPPFWYLHTNNKKRLVSHNWSKKVIQHLTVFTYVLFCITELSFKNMFYQ